MTPPRFIKSLAEICIDDIPLVGGKNASLGEMFRDTIDDMQRYLGPQV